MPEENLINVMSALIAIEYMDHGFRKKYSGAKRWLLFFVGLCAYYTVMTVMNRFMAFEGVIGLAYSVTLIAYGLLALEGKAREIIILGVIWVLIALIGAYVMFGTIGLMTGDSLGEIWETTGSIRTYSAVAAGVLRFSMGRSVLALYRRKNRGRGKDEWLMAGTFLVMYLVVIGMVLMEEGEMSQTQRYDLSLCLLGGMFAIVLLLGKSYRQIGEKRDMEREEEYRRDSRERQEGQIKMLYRIAREVNHMRHDMDGKLGTVDCLLTKGKYMEAKEYIERMEEELGRCPELPRDTGNEGLNAALMKALQECGEKGINFSYVVMGSPKQIDSLDMGNLLYNLLMNGVEACMKKKEGERCLELSVREEGGETEIELENSIRESVLAKNMELMSRKRDGSRHGFGMESIRKIVEKYHGEYTCGEEDGRFCQRICLRSESDKGS